jgi:hypothetical protein
MLKIPSTSLQDSFTCNFQAVADSILNLARQQEKLPKCGGKILALLDEKEEEISLGIYKRI